MVGIRSGRLSDKDIFRGVLWTDEQENAKRDEIEKELKEEGWTVPHLIYFEREKRLMLYKQSQPSWKERQQIWDRIYPVKSSSKVSVSFTEEELTYIKDRMYGSNDEVGIAIFDKLTKYFENNA